MNNLLGIFVSSLFVLSMMLVSSALYRKNLITNEGSRKLIHIGVSNWWIIAMIYFHSSFYAALLPACFIFINYLSYRFTIIKSMERGSGENSLGTVYFPISLFILALLTFSPLSRPYVGALGILIMGYGDGLAAIVGKKFGRKKYYIMGNKKTILGSLTMFTVSMIVSFIVLYLYSPLNILTKTFALASFATIIEAFSPFGLDNLTVPILISLLYQFLFY